jgi:hypothetical protein
MEKEHQATNLHYTGVCLHSIFLENIKMRTVKHLQ